MSDSADDTVEYWKSKSQKLEAVIKTLSTHVLKVVDKHEELLARYKAIEAQYEANVARLKESEAQLAKMGKLVEPVYREYEMMKNKFEIEADCRHYAEHYASKVTLQNNDLKRKSQMLLDSRGLTSTEVIDFDGRGGEHGPGQPAALLSVDGGGGGGVVVVTVEDADATDGKDPQQDYIDRLDEKINSLEESNSSLKTELDSIRKDLDIERDQKATHSNQNEILRGEVKQLKQSLQQHNNALQRLANVSASAFEEYEQLKESYEKEVVFRDQAEQCAAKMHTEKEVAKRQSNLLMKNVAGDKKLMEAMLEVEELTRQAEEQKVQYQRQIKDLQEELQALKEKESVESLEQENGRLLEERESLHQQLSEVRAQGTSLKTQYDSLLKHYEDLERQLEKAKRPPPPPPLPPPPPPHSSKLSFFTPGKKKKAIIEKVQKGGAMVNTDYSKALEEMMQRIKTGQPLKRTLKPIRRPSCPDETDASAMSELRGLLSNIKKASSEGDLLTAVSGDHDDSELAQMFRKIRRPSDSDPLDNEDPPPPSSPAASSVVMRHQSRGSPRLGGKLDTPLSRVSETDETFEDNK